MTINYDNLVYGIIETIGQEYVIPAILSVVISLAGCILFIKWFVKEKGSKIILLVCHEERVGIILLVC